MFTSLLRRPRSRENYIKTLSRLFEFSTVAFRKLPMSKYVDGSQAYTYGTFRHEVMNLSRLMSRFGVSAGDRVAILSQNMPNWTVAMFSAVSFGRIAVPILPDSSAAEVENIIKHSGAKVLFISKRLMFKVSKELLEQLTLVIETDTLHLIRHDDDSFTCEGWVKEPQPDELAAIIYTSGTSGNAKGVMLSHRNFCQNIKAAYHAQKTRKRHVWLSILPMAHTYEMAFSVLYPIYVGGCVNYLQKAPTPSILLQAMKSVRPHIMLSVPLIIEKVYRSSVVPTIEKSRVLTWMRKRFPRLLYYLVGRKLYASFGGRLIFFGIGGSKLDPIVEDFLKKARFPYAIGYGLTETAPLITNAVVGKTRVGSIGVPAYEVEVKLDNVNPVTGEGEIIARGDNVMLGYYKDPDRTRGVISDDGWFHTGDLATVDSKGRYYIKGRLGSTILGPSGENIYPEEIEQVINEIDGVADSLVVDRDGKLVALVKFDENVINWNQEGEDKLFEKLQSMKESLMETVNKRVKKQSKINDVEIMKTDFEKTATMKIRRFMYKQQTPPEQKEEGQEATKKE